MGEAPYQSPEWHPAFEEYCETIYELDEDNVDANDRTLMVVLDAEGRRLGFVTDDYRGYRFRAHEEPELVSNHPELANNLLAIFGWTSGMVTLERQATAD